MSQYQTLKTQIQENIKQNGEGAIRGDILQTQLLDMINTLGAGYQFMGVATPTNPATAQTPDYKCFYLATTPGTYTNLGGLVVADGEVAILKYDTSWTKEVTGIATAESVSQLGQKVNPLTGLFRDSENAILGQIDDTHTQAASGIRVLATPVQGSFVIHTIKAYLPSQNNVHINEYSRNEDGTFKFVRSLYLVSGVQGLLQAGNLNLYVESGHYIGIFATAGVRFGEGTSASAYTLASETGDSISYNYSEGLAIDLQIEGELVGIESFVNGVKDADNANEEIEQLFKNSEAVTFGNLDSSNTLYGKGSRGICVPVDTPTRFSRLYVNAKSKGSITLYACKRESNKLLVAQELGQYALVENMVNRINVDFTLMRNTYLVWVATANIGYKTSGGTDACSISFTGTPVVGDSLDIVNLEKYLWDVQLVGETIGIVPLEKKFENLFKDGNTYGMGNYYLAGNGSFSFNSGGGLTYSCIHKQPIEKTGILKKLFVNATGAGNMSFYKAKQVGENLFDIYGLIGVYSVAEGVNEIDNIDVRVESGDYIAIVILYQCPGIRFNSTPIINCYTPSTSTAFGKNVPVVERGANLCLMGVVETPSITEKETKLDNLPNGGFLYRSETQTDDFVGTGWANFEASSANSYVYLNKATGMDRQVVRAVIKLVDTSAKLGIVGHTYTLGNTFKGQYAMFDFGAKTITLHRSWDGDVSAAEPPVLATQAMFETLYQNRNYILEVEQDTTNKIYVRLYDGLTMEKAEIAYDNTPNPQSELDWVVLTNYPVGLLLKSGTAKVVEVAQYSKTPVRPKLMIYGDSFTQGMNLIRYGFSSDLCYSHLIQSWLDGDCSISCRGGESTAGLLTKIETDMALFKPKYVLLAIGLNDELVDSRSLDDFQLNMTKIINAARKYGAEVILQTYSGNGTVRAQYTSWIMNYSLGFRYFDVRSALALDNTFTSNPELFLADGHPNVQGNQRMFDNFKTFFADIKVD